MSTAAFYGSKQPETISYLEFGAINLRQSKKEIWDFRLHQKAYDWLMHARYSNDLVTYLKMTEMLDDRPLSELAEIYEKEVHHPNDASMNLSKLCAVAACGGPSGRSAASFWELGQTLFGCIEGMEFCRKLLARQEVEFAATDLKDVGWYGLDISDFFNRLAPLMHSGYRVHATDKPERIPDRVDVFFAKGVTLLYACPEPARMTELLTRARCGLFDYSFAIGGPQVSTIGTGKTVTFLDYGQVVPELEKAGIVCHVRSNRTSYNRQTRRLYVECLVGEPEVVRDVQLLDDSVRNALAARTGATPALARFRDLADLSMCAWSPIKEWVAANCS